jgi:VIT1/CCC1 family predicted Fe2+/Mn2+ transporter
MALAFLAVGNIGGMLFMTTNNSVIQTQVPEEYRGRVMAVLMMSFGVMPLGVLPMTIAADAIGAPTAVVVSSISMVVTLALFFIFSARLRTLHVTPATRAELSPAQAAALVAQGKISEEEAARLTGLSELPTASFDGDGASPAPEPVPSRR